VGRKSLNKTRSSDLEKRKRWINNAIPYFQGFLIENNLTVKKAFKDHFKIKFSGLIIFKIPFELG
jgi:hypothetical protein